MVITAIYCPETKEILFSRSRHDFRESSDGKYFIDGGFEYTRIGGNPIMLELDGDYLLRHILDMDYRFGTRNAFEFPMGYQGRFKIVEKSNDAFFSKLIINFEDVREFIFTKEV